MIPAHLNNVKCKNVLVLFVLVVLTIIFYRRSQTNLAALGETEAKKSDDADPPNLTDAHLLPPRADLSSQDLAKHLFDYVVEPQRCCRQLQQFGGVMYGANKLDGDKFVCQDAPFTLQPKLCLVYSVGIANEWSFDRQMVSYGCQVHAFDPSMTNFRGSRAEFGAYFYKIGLAGRTQNKANGWQMSTLSDIRVRLGHDKRVIDYLKIDIEGGEWDFLQHDMDSLTNVRQLAMEIHMTRSISSLKRYYGIFLRLQRLGFRTVHSEPNRVHGPNGYVAGVSYMVGSLYEIVWVNTAFLTDKDRQGA